MIFDADLFDRDGTLIEDVPYNADPEKVRPVPGAREALDRLRAAGLRVGVVSNQSGLARCLFGPEDLARVNARVTELLGHLGERTVDIDGGRDIALDAEEPFRWRRRQIGDGDAEPVGGEPTRAGQPDAAGPTCDECDRAGSSLVTHDRCRPSG